MKAGTLILLTPGFPANESDSTCLPAVQTFVQSVNQIAPDLRIIIISLEYPYVNSEYAWYSNLVIPLNGKKFPWPLKWITWSKAYRKIERLQKENHVTGILSLWCLETALVGKWIAKLKHLKHFIWLHGQDARKTNWLVGIIKPTADQLIAISVFLAKEFNRNHGILPAQIVPNGLLHSFSAISTTERGIDVLGVGSLIPLKQYAVFIEVIKNLIGQFPNINAVICGDGPEKRSLETLIRDNDLDSRIRLTGELEHEKVLDLMRHSKVLLHPSSFEGYSTVCLEALNAGCHVISFVNPEDTSIKKWRIATSSEQMAEYCAEALHDTDFGPVLVHDMKDSAQKILELYT